MVPGVLFLCLVQRLSRDPFIQQAFYKLSPPELFSFDRTLSVAAAEAGCFCLSRSPHFGHDCISRLCSRPQFLRQSSVFWAAPAATLYTSGVMLFKSNPWNLQIRNLIFPYFSLSAPAHRPLSCLHSVIDSPPTPGGQPESAGIAPAEKRTTVKFGLGMKKPGGKGGGFRRR